MTRLPSFGSADEETLKLKIIFSEMAQGKSVGPFIVAHIESVMMLATQPSAPSQTRSIAIEAFLNAVDVLRNLP